MNFFKWLLPGCMILLHPGEAHSCTIDVTANRYFPTTGTDSSPAPSKIEEPIGRIERLTASSCKGLAYLHLSFQRPMGEVGYQIEVISGNAPAFLEDLTRGPFKADPEGSGLASLWLHWWDEKNSRPGRFVLGIRPVNSSGIPGPATEITISDPGGLPSQDMAPSKRPGCSAVATTCSNPLTQTAPFLLLPFTLLLIRTRNQRTTEPLPVR